MSVDQTSDNEQNTSPEESHRPLQTRHTLVEMDQKLLHLEQLLDQRTAELKITNSRLLKRFSEKNILEEELLRLKKLESVGVLAGGIAHDFNNLLTAISGNVSLAKMYLSANDKAYSFLEKVEHVSIRASDLTRQLVALSREGDPIKRPAVIDDLIKKAALFSLSGSNVRCEFTVSLALLPVLCDEGQIRQVIHNMVLNARDAMTGGGLVTISATNTDVIGSQGLLLPEGDYVAITITDRGVGIPEQTMLRIFEPYFTTKETCNQKKLGLGLSICYSIIQAHGGHITVRSKPGEGTTFIIYLPVAKSKKTTGQNSVDVPPTGSARVLIMDDEDAVRTIAVEMLQHMGCEVESAGDGTEAIGLFKKALQTGAPFDVVILDLTVAGGMGGEETIKKLVEIDPKVKAIVSSGYSNVRVMSDYSSFGFRGVLAKPFNIFDLGKSVFSLKNAEA